MIESIYGIFLKDECVLLLQRAPTRTFNRNKFDLMGGDIEPGHTPVEMLIKDALRKLNIGARNIRYRDYLIVTEGVTEPLRKHLFLAEGDYSDIRVDLSKYSNFIWKKAEEIKSLDLCPGVEQALTQTGFLPK